MTLYLCHHNGKGGKLEQRTDVQEGLLPPLCILKDGFFSRNDSFHEYELTEK